jgi:cysteinyl-tRNA synthetase
LGGCLGLLQGDPQEFLQAGASLDAHAIETRIAQRSAAKADRNFALADQIRTELLGQGVVLKDAAGGTSWEVVQ